MNETEKSMNELLIEFKGALGNLSMKINQIQSDLREFEKQIIQPAFEDLEMRIQNLEEGYQGLFHDTAYLEEKLKELGNKNAKNN